MPENLVPDVMDVTQAGRSVGCGTGCGTSTTSSSAGGRDLKVEDARGFRCG